MEDLKKEKAQEEEIKEKSPEEIDEKTQEEETKEKETESPKEEKTEAPPGDKEKKPKKQSKKEKLKEDLAEMTDKYQRLFAEFQNYRSRNEKEKSEMYEMGKIGVIEKLLPIVDDFERGIEALGDDKDSPAGEGMNLIYKKLTDTLSEMGVEVIEAEGQQFDPELHNAVMHEDNDEYEENIIVEEFQKGYKYNDTVIRHSMVKVAN